MDYIGSKEKLNEWIFSIIMKNVENDGEGLTFMDACAGSGAVSTYAAKFKFNKIISNDIMEFPSHIVRGRISTPADVYTKAKDLVQQMNCLGGIEGFFYENYSENSGRLYFSDENAKKIDNCRAFIDAVFDNNYYLKSYLLYCLIEALSSVSNTTGVQAAFLKKLKERAKRPIFIKNQPCLSLFQKVKTFNKDILSLLKSKELRDGYQENILYIDPPYNERQYGPNYHLYETLVKNDEPDVYGKTGLRDWKNESKSDFCSKKTCLSFTKEIVDNTTASNVYISYNSDGLLKLEEFEFLFGNKMKVFEMDQKRYKSDSKPNREYDESKLKEYLIRITK